MEYVYFHELGHSLGLGHAATPTCSACDTTSAMAVGIGGSSLCFDAADNSLIGWSTPTTVIDISALTQATQLTLPSQLSGPQNFAMVTGAAAGKLFISFRRNIAPNDVPFNQQVSRPDEFR